MTSPCRLKGLILFKTGSTQTKLASGAGTDWEKHVSATKTSLKLLGKVSGVDSSGRSCSHIAALPTG